ncbi:MAG: phage terminase large subunit [Thermodesulfobacteriota bacterium]
MSCVETLNREIVYKPESTPKRFHLSDAFVRGLIGPIGSGKSVSCCWELMMKAHEQAPFEGIRSSRWIIVRNTYRELMDTTMETFFSWFPKSTGDFQKMNMKFIYRKKLDDGTIVYAEFLFRALDKPDDIKKLLSLELTGGWLNEVREIPKSVVDMLIGRLGRYPRTGVTWSGLIMDTNPPDEDHWWYKLFEVDCPGDYEIFHQPSGLSKEAENLHNLLQKPEHSTMTMEERKAVGRVYYTRMVAGKDEEWINVYVHGKYGFVVDGKAIYPEFNDAIHVSRQEIILPEACKENTIWIGIDFGRTPAAAFGFQATDGQWIIFDEMVTDNMGARRFSEVLGQKIRQEFSKYHLEIWGDPKGADMTQVDDETPYLVLRGAGIEAWPANTNDPVIRREAVAINLMRLTMSGKPGFIIGPKARILRKSMNGGYKYKRMAIAGQERYQEKPDKNMYSHIAEAVQYLMIGAGEGDELIGATLTGQKPIDYSELDRAVI